MNIGIPDTLDAIHAAILEIDDMQHDDLIIAGLDYAILRYLEDSDNLEIVLNRDDCELDVHPARYTDGTDRLYTDPAVVHLTRWMLDNGYHVPKTSGEMQEAINPDEIPCYVHEVTIDVIGKASVNACAIQMCADWFDGLPDTYIAYTDAF